MIHWEGDITVHIEYNNVGGPVRHGVKGKPCGIGIIHFLSSIPLPLPPVEEGGILLRDASPLLPWRRGRGWRKSKGISHFAFPILHLFSCSMSIVTKTGDQGETGLVGGARISKADARMHAIGSVDELNALLGVLLAEQLPAEIAAGVTRIQNELFTLGADLATPRPSVKVPRITQEHIAGLEAWIASLESALPPLQAFILPGGSRAGALLHSARTVCRRAERWVVSLDNTVSEQSRIYLNRLSDLLFLLARAVNRERGAEEREVEY